MYFANLLSRIILPPKAIVSPVIFLTGNVILELNLSMNFPVLSFLKYKPVKLISSSEYFLIIHHKIYFAKAHNLIEILRWYFYLNLFLINILLLLYD